MIPVLSFEQREGMGELGLPLPVYDPLTEKGYVLLEANITPDPLGGFLASVDGLQGLGGGDSPEEALLALSVLLGKMADDEPQPTQNHPYN